MRELVRYLLENIQIDFQGNLDLDTIRTLLSNDNSPEARQLLNKLNQDGSVDDFLLTLADVLKPIMVRGVTDQVLREQIAEYAES